MSIEIALLKIRKKEKSPFLAVSSMVYSRRFGKVLLYVLVVFHS